ncbi:hypothetical protein pb186bvf_005051 [Paramecium bursaria]
MQISIYYKSTIIVGGQSTYLFGGQINNNIQQEQGLITDIQQQCELSEKSFITIEQSEIVDKSQFLSKFNNYYNVMIHLSLNNEQILFQNKLIGNNTHQVWISNNNNYLYLPSGRSLRDYKYLNYKTGVYHKLYDSISIVSLYQTQSLKCYIMQILDNQTLPQMGIIIYQGVNVINNLVITLNPLLKINTYNQILFVITFHIQSFNKNIKLLIR